MVVEEVLVVKFFQFFVFILLYEACLESIHPFRIYREPVAWSRCNLAAIQRRTYCACKNSHSNMGLVSWQ